MSKSFHFIQLEINKCHRMGCHVIPSVEGVDGELLQKGCRCPPSTLMMSQFGPVTVSDGEEDSMSLMEGVPDSCLYSAPPALQLRMLQQDITAAGRWLWTHVYNQSLICSQKPHVIQSQPLTCMSSQTASRSATVMSSPHRNGCLRRNMDSSLSRVSSS